MFKKLYPNMYVNSILDIPLQRLHERNLRAFILDLDNTITEWNSNTIHGPVGEWFTLIRNLGFKACILSNNGEDRVLSVASNLDIPFIHRAKKPRRGSFYRAMEMMGVTAEETAVIGDQIFTDILGGNRAGLYTILVVPVARREFFGTKISRAIEKPILIHLKSLQRRHYIQ